MSQTALAELVGYKDKTSIAKIEAGKVDLPQSKILAFANALNTTPSYLLNWSDSSDGNGKNKVYADVSAKNEQEAIYIAMKNMFIANGNQEHADKLTEDDAVRLYEECGLETVKKVLLKTFPDIQFKENIDEDFISSKESSVLKDIESKMTAADVLSIRRDNKGFTQKQLSEITGIAVPNISQMENGSRKIGKVNAKKLAAALECDAADFFMYL